MRTANKVFLVCFLILAVMVTSGCISVKKFGQPISVRQTTAITDILANPKSYDGKPVTIEGRVAEECSTGCWFYVQASAGNVSIYVDIEPAGLAIPQYRGKKVVVEGTVKVKEAGPIIQGKGVEVG